MLERTPMCGGYSALTGGQVERYKLDKYDVTVGPMPGSMLKRYSVYLHGRLLGTRLSVPGLADCHAMEHPPAPLTFTDRSYSGNAARPGRPTERARVSKQHAAMLDPTGEMTEPE